MDKEAMISAINSKFEELKNALEGDNLENIRQLTLDLHAMVHPAEISGSVEKTITEELSSAANGKMYFLRPR